MFDRYARQLALPEITLKDQQRLQQTRITCIGAGGLGSAALPYLASAGIGHITIYDHDEISRSNLHRQTLYKDFECGQSKAEATAKYLAELNPDITVEAKSEKFTTNQPISQSANQLLIDGSDNFETKTLLNQISIETKTPLLSASVNQWAGQIGLFAGYAKSKPCYHCLFPELPSDARNCNEAGILGTSAGITGVTQAHIALGYLLGLEGFEPGLVLSFDFKTLRMQKLHLEKDISCAHCKEADLDYTPIKKDQHMAELISFEDLKKQEHVIVDVRTDAELQTDPISSDNVIHMELQTVPARHEELPKDKTLAFVCAGNIRSVQAAEYLQGLGYENIIVLDKFSIPA